MPSLADTGSGIAGYRILRRIGSGRRAEVFLAIAQAAEGGAGPGIEPARGAAASESAPLVVMRIYRDDVDDLSVACELDAMHSVPDAGMPSLLDVATAPSGERVAVVERIGGASVAQIVHERSLEPGEAVTLAAPVVAGIAELAAAGFVHPGLTVSDVQLDSSGRPRLLGLGALERLPPDPVEATMARRRGLEALSAYVEQVVSAVRPAGVFDDALALARASLAARPFVPFEAGLERALFGAASPAAVSGIPAIRELRIPARMLEPKPPLDVPADGAPGPTPAFAEPVSGLVSGMLDLAELPAPVLERLATAADTDRIATVRQRWAAWIVARRRPLLVGVLLGAAALVLLLTAVPSGDGAAGAGESASSGGAAAASAPAGATRDLASATPDGGEPTSGATAKGAAELEAEDPVAAADMLLALRETCFETLDPACLAGYVQPGSPLEEADWNRMLAARDGGEGILPLDRGAVEIVTEMGAAVLVEVAGAADDEPASLLMVRSEAGWRLREIFD